MSSKKISSRLLGGILAGALIVALTGCGSSGSSSSASAAASASTSAAATSSTSAASEKVASAVSSGSDAEEGAAIQAIKKRGVLNIGTEDSAIGFGYMDPSTNEWSGLEVDLGKLVAESLGVEPKFQAVTTSTRGQLLDSGDLDMVAATFTITDERKLSYDFTEPYYTDAQSVLVLKSSGLKTIDDFDGKKIGVSAGGTEKDSISAITDAKIDFVEYSDFADAKMALSAGTIDGFAADSSILLSYLDDSCTYIDTKFSPQPYGIATKKGSDLSAYINDLVVKWKEDGTIDKLIKDNGVQPSYTEDSSVSSSSNS